MYVLRKHIRFPHIGTKYVHCTSQAIVDDEQRFSIPKNFVAMLNETINICENGTTYRMGSMYDLQ